MDVETDLNPIRADLRAKDEDYDQFALPFIEEQITTESSSQIINFFPYFSHDMQITVANKLFSLACSLDCDNKQLKSLFILILDIIQALENENYFDPLDISQQMIDLLKLIFGSNFSIKIQQKILNIFSSYIFTHYDLKTPEFYDVVLNIMQQFSDTLNLLPLFISIVSNPPFPPQQLIESIVNTIYANEYETKYTSKTFRFFEFCVKNELDINYEPFFQKIDIFLSSGNEKIYCSFIDFLIELPEAKPEFLDELLHFEEAITNDEKKIKIFLLFFKPNYRNDWLYNNADMIVECALKNIRSENYDLRTLAILAYIYYQQIPRIPYDGEIAQIMVDNFENPLLTIPILSLLLHWIFDDTMENDIKEQVYNMVISEYDNLKLVINSREEDDKSAPYSLLFESLIDKIYSY